MSYLEMFIAAVLWAAAGSLTIVPINYIDRLRATDSWAPTRSLLEQSLDDLWDAGKYPLEFAIFIALWPLFLVLHTVSFILWRRHQA